MDDNIPVIHQNPTGIRFALYVQRRDVQFSQFSIDSIGDSSQLAVAFAGANYKVICEAADVAGIQ